MTPFFLSQVLIGIAICSDLLSFQFKERNRIIACLAFSCTLISLHFVLLGKMTAALLLGIAATRYVTGIFTTSKKTMGLFALASVACTAVTYAGMISIVGCSGSLLQTVAAFCEEDKRLRELMIVGTIFWILHNILARSPMAVAMEVLFLSSNIVGYYRYYGKTKRPGFTALK